MLTFDPDGDQVRCRAATDRSRYECAFCSLLKGFTLNQVRKQTFHLDQSPGSRFLKVSSCKRAVANQMELNSLTQTQPMFFQTSCSLTYKSYSTGYHPFELMVEDFPKSPISLSYSDGSYTHKRPDSVLRQKRQAFSNANVTTPTPRVYRKSIPALSRVPLQFSIYGLLLLFSNGRSLKPVCWRQAFLHRLLPSGPLLRAVVRRGPLLPRFLGANSGSRSDSPCLC